VRPGDGPSGTGRFRDGFPRSDECDGGNFPTDFSLYRGQDFAKEDTVLPAEICPLSGAKPVWKFAATGSRGNRAPQAPSVTPFARMAPCVTLPTRPLRLGPAPSPRPERGEPPLGPLSASHRSLPCRNALPVGCAARTGVHCAVERGCERGWQAPRDPSAALQHGNRSSDFLAPCAARTGARRAGSEGKRSWGGGVAHWSPLQTKEQCGQVVAPLTSVPPATIREWHTGRGRRVCVYWLQAQCNPCWGRGRRFPAFEDTSQLHRRKPQQVTPPRTARGSRG